MDLLIVAGIVAFIVWVAGVAVRDSYRSWQIEQRQKENQKLEAKRREQAAILKRQNVLRRRLQIAQGLTRSLEQLDQTPDFRRAASWAAHGSSLSVSHRQGLFRKFRPKLIQHYSKRLAAETDAQVLHQSLCDLLSALSIAPFEADYIRQQATRNTPPSNITQENEFRERLTRYHREHQERLAAVQSLAGLDDETRERLLEVEVERYRDALLSLGGNGRQQGW